MYGMKTLDLRQSIHNYIDKADERFLRMVHSLAKEYGKENDAIAGYSTDGKPISNKQLIARAQKANEDIKSGHCVSQESLEKEVESW
jgi:hypothetical protein